MTSLGSPGARSTGFARVEASGSRTYPHAAAMVSKGMRLMTSKSTRYGLFRFTPDAPGVAVDGDERGVADQAVDGACDDSFLPPRHGIGRLSCQTEKPHGKKRMAEWERRHAVPGATAKQSSKPGKINRRRALPAYRTRSLQPRRQGLPETAAVAGCSCRCCLQLSRGETRTFHKMPGRLLPAA